MATLPERVLQEDDTLYTANLAPGETVYGEVLVERDGTEYRRWDPHRSKAAAALAKGLQHFPLERGSDVLYLGASTGTTVSHVSDIAADGMVYAVEVAAEPTRKLLSVAEQRGNVAPILGDARTPQEYAPLCSAVDVIYQDVAQRDQAAILQRNAELFLRDGGYAFLAIKAQSISSEKSPETVFEEAKEQLRETFDIVAGKKLEPFHADHLVLVLQY